MPRGQDRLASPVSPSLPSPPPSSSSSVSVKTSSSERQKKDEKDRLSPSSPSPGPKLVDASQLPARRYPQRSTRATSSACSQYSSSPRGDKRRQGGRDVFDRSPDSSGRGSRKGGRSPFHLCLDSQQIPLLLPAPGAQGQGCGIEIGKKEAGREDCGVRSLLSSSEAEERESHADKCVPEEEGDGDSCMGKAAEEGSERRHQKDGPVFLDMEAACQHTVKDQPALSAFPSFNSSLENTAVRPVFFLCKDWDLGELLRDPVGSYTLAKLLISPSRKWRVSYSTNSSSSSLDGSSACSLLQGEGKREERENEERHAVARIRQKEKVGEGGGSTNWRKRWRAGERGGGRGGEEECR